MFTGQFKMEQAAAHEPGTLSERILVFQAELPTLTERRYSLLFPGGGCL